MTYVSFINSNRTPLAFGVFLTAFSSVGQTYFIALFTPQILESLNLNAAQYGFLYAAATTSSAVVLPWCGRLVDKMPLRRFCILNSTLLFISCMAMSLAQNSFILFFALLGLRLSGQGLMGLIASTTMARSFSVERGRALSVSSLGYPLGEMLFPLIVVTLIGAFGWRLSWIVIALFTVLVILPLSAYLAGHGKLVSGSVVGTEAPSSVARRRLIFDWNFWALIPLNIYPPMVITALFLYQLPLGAENGWSPELMASAFVAFAIGRFVVSLLVGPLIDRWSAMNLFPFISLPMVGAFALIWWGGGSWIAFSYLLLTGVTLGVSSSAMTALWAEIFGVQSLGATKGAFASLSVLATALGPMLCGLLLNYGLSYSQLALIGALSALVIVVYGVIVRRILVQRIVSTGCSELMTVDAVL